VCQFFDPFAYSTAKHTFFGKLQMQQMFISCCEENMKTKIISKLTTKTNRLKLSRLFGHL